MLNEWFRTPLGKVVIEGIKKQWESFDLSRSVVYGNCLQIGTDASILPLKKSLILTTEYTTGTHVITSLDTLPFQSESFSLVILPFTLEFSQNIAVFFDEIARILTADGIVCVIGVNPLSLWGGTRLFSSKAIWPTKLHWHTSLRVYSSLALRHFHLHGIKSFFYRPPFSSANLLNKTNFLESMGQMFWPYPGGLYFLLAQKRTPQFLSVEPLWQTGGYVFGKT